MNTICTTVYSFEELSAHAKEWARDWYREGALDYDWWDCTYEDAARIGLTLQEFDIGRSQTIAGQFIDSGRDTARAIIAEHGNKCETYRTAIDYLYRRPGAFLEDDFLYELLQDYLIILRNEYEYLMSEESVDESIECNEYTFTESGKRFG